jgi:hypothetical protein
MQFDNIQKLTCASESCSTGVIMIPHDDISHRPPLGS